MAIRQSVVLTIVAVVSVALGITAGYFIGLAMHRSTSASKAGGVVSMALRETVWDNIVKKVNPSRIEANLRYLSAKPHVAASPRNNELADEYERRFKAYGFDEVEKLTYNVLLSYPNRNKPNYAYILDSSNKTKFTTKLMEDILDPAENSSDVYQPFNAFSPAKSASGKLVYVNYGRREDFKKLKDVYNISCAGKIVIVRYGKLYRGEKVRNAESNGAKGILLYNDPQDYGPVPANETYPNSLWMPRGGVQRGSIGPGGGDVLTPGWPSTDDAYRLPVENAPGLPKIPCHPISARDAKQFLSKLQGPTLNDSDWIGGLGITYRLGPGFNKTYKGWSVKIEIHNSREILKITNVIGTIKGATDPDRYVMVGNHRDSWVFGGVDGSSGGSILLELAKLIGEHKKSGWRPARSMKFCSWGGEEAGLIGSSEYVEQHIKILRDRAVLYVNIDTAVYGNYSILLAASQLTYETIYENLKKVKDANTDMTMFQKAIAKTPWAMERTKPKIWKVGKGSDFTHFYNYGAIPVIDIRHGMQDIQAKKKSSYFPVYHSLHDTYHWVKTFIDPKFECHRSVGEFTGRLLLQYADSIVIPFDPRTYTPALQKGVDDFKNLLATTNASANNVNTDYLQKAVNMYRTAANELKENIDRIDRNSLYQVRLANDQLSLLEKGFLYYPGLPGKPAMRHIIFSPPEVSSYGVSAFPGAADLLYEITMKKKRWGDLNKHLSFIASSIEGVAMSLKKA